MKKKLFFCTAVILLLFFVIPEIAHAGPYAQEQLNAAAGAQGARFGTAKDPRAILATVIQITLACVGILFTVYLVYGGFLMLTSRGEEEKITKGRKILQWGVIGMLIIFNAYAILLFINRYMGGAPGEGKADGPFWSSFEFTTDKDTSEFSNPDPLYEKSPAGNSNFWEDIGAQK